MATTSPKNIFDLFSTYVEENKDYVLDTYSLINGGTGSKHTVPVDISKIGEYHLTMLGDALFNIYCSTNVIKAPTVNVSVTTLYTSFRQWLKTNEINVNLIKYFNDIKIHGLCKTAGFQSNRISSGMVWKDIKIINNTQIALGNGNGNGNESKNKNSKGHLIDVSNPLILLLAKSKFTYRFTNLNSITDFCTNHFYSEMVKNDENVFKYHFEKTYSSGERFGFHRLILSVNPTFTNNHDIESLLIDYQFTIKYGDWTYSIPIYYLYQCHKYNEIKNSYAEHNTLEIELDLSELPHIFSSMFDHDTKHEMIIELNDCHDIFSKSIIVYTGYIYGCMSYFYTNDICLLTKYYETIKPSNIHTNAGINENSIQFIVNTEDSKIDGSVNGFYLCVSNEEANARNIISLQVYLNGILIMDYDTILLKTCTTLINDNFVYVPINNQGLMNSFSKNRCDNFTFNMTFNKQIQPEHIRLIWNLSRAMVLLHQKSKSNLKTASGTDLKLPYVNFGDEIVKPRRLKSYPKLTCSYLCDHEMEYSGKYNENQKCSCGRVMMVNCKIVSELMLDVPELVCDCGNSGGITSTMDRQTQVCTCGRYLVRNGDIKHGLLPEIASDDLFYYSEN